MQSLKIVAISDVHNRFNKLVIPECDLLISCGDYSSMGYLHEVKAFHKWLNKQPARYIISVQGNHEKGVETNFNEFKAAALEECAIVHFIDEGLVEIEGVKIWCSAITPFFFNWAWNRHRGQDIQYHWNKIPDDTNILVTHGPPYGILDTSCFADGTPRPGNLGCYQLMERIKQLKDLDLHFFGHIHHPGGQQVHQDGVSFYNCAICDECYLPTNPITIVDYIRA